MNKCTSIAGHFDGQEVAFEQCMRHCPMEEIQGFSGSHWTPPLGDYSLHIALVAARTTIDHTTMKKTPTVLAVLMAIAMRCYC